MVLFSPLYAGFFVGKYMQEIISRKDAKNKNLKEYYTGIPCKYGHVDYRIVINGCCKTCLQEKRKENIEKIKQRSKNYYYANREHSLRVIKHYRDTHKEQTRATAKKYRMENKEKLRENFVEYYAKNIHEYNERSKKYRQTARCKETRRNYYRDNKEHIVKWQKEYRQRNKKHLSFQNILYRMIHKEDINISSRRYRQQNRPLLRAQIAKRRAQKLQATPIWHINEHQKIQALYQAAEYLSQTTKQSYHIDHVIPLVNDNVCGLHCLDNLQILLSKDNLSKGNKFDF